MLSFVRFAFLSTIIAVVVGLTGQAFAQGTKVVVVDQARVMRDSMAGQDIAQKVRSIGEQMSNELEPEATALDTEEKAIAAKTQGKTREAVAADPALRQEVESYARKLNEFQRKRQKRAQELTATEQQAWATFNTSLREVLQEVIDETGASVVIDRSQIVFTGEDVDVTGSVITKLNGKAPTIQVTRVTLPDQPVTTQQ